MLASLHLRHRESSAETTLAPAKWKNRLHGPSRSGNAAPGSRKLAKQRPYHEFCAAAACYPLPPEADVTRRPEAVIDRRSCAK